MKVEDLFEEIKGWKHAGRDLAKHRASLGKDVKLVRLKKDGAESGMNDATKLFRSEEEARRHHTSMVQLNPGKSIKHNLYVDGKKELLEGWFSKKKEPKLNRTDFTDEERKMIKSVFPTGSNVDLKHGEKYVLPQNVTLNFKRSNVNFYKDGDQILASVGWYRDEDGPGNPRTSPMFHTDHKISSIADLKKLKAEMRGEKHEDQ